MQYILYSRCKNTSNTNQNKQNQISNNYKLLPAEYGQKPLLAIVAEDLLQIVVATQMEAVLVGTADTEDWCPECFCNIEDIPFTNVRCLSNGHNRMSNCMMPKVLELAIPELGPLDAFQIKHKNKTSENEHIDLQNYRPKTVLI